MRIAIIGAGKVGTTLADRFVNLGHEVVFGLRDLASPKLVALRERLPTVHHRTNQEAVLGAEIVILAVPFNAVEALLRSLGDLQGTVVIDATNPIGRTPEGLGLTLGFDDSGGERVAHWTKGARVVKTLNQVGWEIMRHAASFPQAPLMYLAGNDTEAKRIVSELLIALGFEPRDAGMIKCSRLLEPLAMLWINQALLRGEGPRFALTLTINEGMVEGG